MRNPYRKTVVSASDRLRRMVWNVACSLLYCSSPNFMFGWRRVLLRCFGATIERGAHPYPTAKIWAPWNLWLGEDACLGPDVDCYNVAAVKILAGAIVSQGAFLCTASHDYRDPLFPLITAPITISDGSWICARAFIGPGVNVGARAVVAACSVVTGDVPANYVVGGNPVTVIKSDGRVLSSSEPRVCSQ